MAAQCQHCGQPAKHKPECPVLFHIKVVRLVTGTASAYLTKPSRSQYLPGQEGNAAFNAAFRQWRDTIRELALMLAESHPDYTRVGEARREWSDDLEVALREAMGLEGADDAGAGENPD